MEWINQPIVKSVELEECSDCVGCECVRTLSIECRPNTDFWRKSHYGFIRDNGHFWYRKVEGSFEASVRFSAKYKERYDQAGLMIRVDSENWLKTGVELEDGVQNISAVVTRDYSDWSVLALEAAPEQVFLKIKYEAGRFQILYSVDGLDYRMFRLGFLSGSESVQVGVFAASPGDSAGFEVEFRDFCVKTAYPEVVS